jgi:hypothetical protein
MKVFFSRSANLQSLPLLLSSSSSSPSPTVFSRSKRERSSLPYDKGYPSADMGTHTRCATSRYGVLSFMGGDLGAIRFWTGSACVLRVCVVRGGEIDERL